MRAQRPSQILFVCVRDTKEDVGSVTASIHTKNRFVWNFEYAHFDDIFGNTDSSFFFKRLCHISLAFIMLNYCRPHFIHHGPI